VCVECFVVFCVVGVSGVCTCWQFCVEYSGTGAGAGAGAALGLELCCVLCLFCAGARAGQRLVVAVVEACLVDAAAAEAEVLVIMLRLRLP